MQPADIAIALRRRSPWEAMDLGLTMLQRWWCQVYLPHCLVALPLMALAGLAAWWLQRPWVALLAVWWMKPVFDRVVLHVLSRAVFGELPGTRAVLGAWREWLGTGVLMALSFGRIDTARSFNLPVRQLEGQSGRAARERRGVLGRRVGGYATWLTFVTFALEIVVLWGSFGLLAELFLPATADEGKPFLETLFGAGDEETGIVVWEDAFTYPLAVLLLEPFYVAAGFALYLNRRTLLEGWDIEVALRRIAQRHVAAIVFLVMSVLAVIPVESVHAQQRDAKREIQEVLKAKEFGYYKDTKQWQARTRDSKSGFNWDWRWLRAVGYALAKVGEILLWVGAGAAVAYALWWLARLMPRGREAAPEPYKPPAALFGVEIAPEKLPPDVGAAAAALVREGKLREALGLLYRGSLSELVHKRGVRLLASHTEGDVIRLSGNMSYLTSLIPTWQSCAYASRVPPAHEVERLAADYGKAFA